MRWGKLTETQKSEYATLAKEVDEKQPQTDQQRGQAIRRQYTRSALGTLTTQFGKQG